MKICNSFKYNPLFLIISGLYLFNITSCGLDTIYIVDAPTTCIHQPQYQNIDYSDRYFEFWTNENNDLLGFDFTGTDVYYKIYTSYSQMTVETGVLNSLIANNTSNPADKMINTTSSGGYGYKALRVRNNQKIPLVPDIGKNQRVYIRLTDYQELNDYSSVVLVDGLYLNGSTEKTVPVRNTPDRRTFNFGRNGSLDLRPANGDEDVKYTTSSEDISKFYVAMYAVGVGMDASYLTYYSTPLYLGSVTIDSSVYDN